MRPRGIRSRTLARLWIVGSLFLVVAFVAPPMAYATVSISRAEVKGTQLRIEGTAAANRTITVDGVAMGTSDGSGRFKIERSGFTAPADCTVDVNDGSATATSARLSGCTVSSDPSPSPDASLSALSLNPTTVVGGTSAQGTVTLTAAAPTGGFEVLLESNNTAAATVPPSVTVAAGSTSATFTVTTNVVSNSQSSTIIATAGGVTKASTITVTTQFQSENGSVSLSRGGRGEGRVTSQPAGIDCTFTTDGTSGTCSNAFFPAGTDVKLDARPADNSKFLGWEFEVNCPDAPKVRVAAGVAHICRPVFALK
jgi:hypothetical protein